MIGPLLIIGGLLGMYVAYRGKAEGVFDALGLDFFYKQAEAFFANLSVSSSSSSSSGGSGSSHSGGSAGGSVDSGSHQALVDGVIVTIDKPYAQMTDTEKGAANDFAHQFPNGM